VEREEKRGLTFLKKKRILNRKKKRKNTGTLFSDLQSARKMHSEAKSCTIDFSVGLCLVTTQKTHQIKRHLQYFTCIFIQFLMYVVQNNKIKRNDAKVSITTYTPRQKSFLPLSFYATILCIKFITKYRYDMRVLYQSGLHTVLK
jgi:hypothetical protein